MQVDQNRTVRRCPMENIIIRRMQEDEIEWCAAVIRKGFGTVARSFGLTIENCPTNGAFMKTERLKEDWEKGKDMYVLLSDNLIIGFMELEKKEESRVELQKLTVLLKYRHYGYGRRLIEYAKQRAKELDAEAMTIGIIEENTVLKDWYLKNGFLHNGTHVFEHLPFTVGFLSMKIDS
jgi:ribosomal protein S18 acetylase RimI-like enzyme